MEENKELEATEPNKVFYTVTDPDTGRKYNIPDLTGNIDLIQAIKEAHPKGKISPEEKITAAALWLVLGSSYKVSDIMQIPDRTIRAWTTEPWWFLALREVKKAKNEELDAKMTSLLEDITAELVDRVHNGDSKVDRDGNLVRVPVNLAHLGATFAAIFDKRAVLRADPNTKVAKTDVTEHLEQVASKLERLVGKIPNPTTIEDAEYTEVGTEN